MITFNIPEIPLSIQVLEPGSARSMFQLGAPYFDALENFLQIYVLLVVYYSEKLTDNRVPEPNIT